MPCIVAQLATYVKRQVAQGANDMESPVGLNSDMAMDRIHRGKQPNRPHFIPEWAERRGYENQAELAEALDVDKSMVSRWYSGTSPSEKSQIQLAALFHCSRDALFRHPDDDWLSKFFRDRSDNEMERIKQMLEAAFPKSQKTS